ncbi:hypothetical protein [Symbiopectobacterium sp. RP]|uniref:hypothetical protein n=1 Tax=Symbiopectobacterium sp. RP TaxID=3248553 RepID=UPI003D2A9F8F
MVRNARNPYHGQDNCAIANRLKNDYSQCPDMWQKNTANCYQNNVAWLYSINEYFPIKMITICKTESLPRNTESFF